MVRPWRCVPSPTLPHACGTRRELLVDCQGRMVQSSIMNCSCDYSCGGVGTYWHSSLLVENCVRVLRSNFCQHTLTLTP